MVHFIDSQEGSAGRTLDVTIRQENCESPKPNVSARQYGWADKILSVMTSANQTPARDVSGPSSLFDRKFFEGRENRRKS